VPCRPQWECSAPNGTRARRAISRVDAAANPCSAKSSSAASRMRAGVERGSSRALARTSWRIGRVTKAYAQGANSVNPPCRAPAAVKSQTRTGTSRREPEGAGGVVPQDLPLARLGDRLLVEPRHAPRPRAFGMRVVGVEHDVVVARQLDHAPERHLVATGGDEHVA